MGRRRWRRRSTTGRGTTRRCCTRTGRWLISEGGGGTARLRQHATEATKRPTAGGAEACLPHSQRPAGIRLRRDTRPTVRPNGRRGEGTAGGQGSARPIRRRRTFGRTATAGSFADAQDDSHGQRPAGRGDPALSAGGRPSAGLRRLCRLGRLKPAVPRRGGGDGRRAWVPKPFGPGWRSLCDLAKCPPYPPEADLRQDGRQG
jgi:hypothetical protein